MKMDCIPGGMHAWKSDNSNQRTGENGIPHHRCPLSLSVPCAQPYFSPPSRRVSTRRTASSWPCPPGTSSRPMGPDRSAPNHTAIKPRRRAEMSIPAPAGRRSAGPPQPANRNPRQLGHELPQPATRSSAETPGLRGALSAIAGSPAGPESSEPEPVLDPSGWPTPSRRPPG